MTQHRLFRFAFAFVAATFAAGCAAESNDPPRAFIAFDAKVDALRTTPNAECGEKIETPADDDQLLLTADSRQRNAEIERVSVSFERKDPAKADVSVVFRNMESRPIVAWSATVLELPREDGKTLSAHVVVELADGAVLDTTFGAPVVTSFGSCPTGGE